ncbi:hypothetical protein BJ170DRAFT_590260 [Xylariales sp. AK1849]|nr:hypothetical protein BJ170DRAFT_590260 [Xylariales sp. AK1849]
MKPSTIISVLTALASIAVATERTAAIYIQPVSSNPSTPALLAEVSYDASHPAGASISSFEFPELPDDDAVKNVRIGVYSPSSKTWESSTSVASVANFGKGYRPHVMLSVDAKGDVASAALRGVRIDAGQTRDFGPKAVVVVAAKGAQVELNKPVVLTPEGKKPAEAEEKTLLQKYVSLNLLRFAAGRGMMFGRAANETQVLVGYWNRGLAYHDGRRRRGQMIDVFNGLRWLFSELLWIPT